MVDQGLLFTIFGGTGDLARRKLVPALYNLFLGRALPEGFALVGVGRRGKSSEDYRGEMARSVEEYSPETWDRGRWLELAEKIYYYSADLEQAGDYADLGAFIEKCAFRHGTGGNNLFYLALAPSLFAPVVNNLDRLGHPAPAAGWRRVLIEKPFGLDLASATELNRTIAKTFGEENVYRIDHYLGKEMLQNILAIRFANPVFEPLWNCSHIDNVQITVAESDGIGDRGRYYDRVGALRDMVQSHLLQVLAVMAMEPPSCSEGDAVRLEKLALLGALRVWPPGEGPGVAVFGQYAGFRDEKDVSSESFTETYAAVKLKVDNRRWKGVPFYLRTGKRLRDKAANAVVQFKADSGALQGFNVLPEKCGPGAPANLLTMKIQPSEGVVFRFNIKKPAVINEIIPVEMDFCQPCAFMINSPEAYEKLIEDAIRGDITRFTSWEEVECAWRLTDSIVSRQADLGLPPVVYEPGGEGPAEAAAMLAESGRRWWDYT